MKKLREIEQAIRSRAHEAREEVRRGKEEADRITREAEAESAKIRAEADRYHQKRLEEIRQVQAKNPALAPGLVPAPSPPSSQELYRALASLAEPIRGCWEPPSPAEAARTVAQVEACVAEQIQQKLRPYLRKDSAK